MDVVVTMLQESCFFQNWMVSPDCLLQMLDNHLRKHLWLYCPGHGGVKGNTVQTDWRARQRSQAACVLKIGSVEELKTLPFLA